MTAWEAIDATIAVDVEVADRVWRIHEALMMARRQHLEVDQTLRRARRSATTSCSGSATGSSGRAPATEDRVGMFADMLWGLLNIGTYRSLVVERGWSLDQYERWLGTTPAPDRRP